MAFKPFGIASSATKARREPKASPIAEFADPSHETFLTDRFQTGAERDTESLRLQEVGSRHAESGSFSAALRSWDQAIELTPDRAVLHELKAQVFLETNHSWDAVCSATKATQLDSTWPEAFLTLARAQLTFGEPESALVQLEKVLDLQPGHAEATAEIDTVRMLVLQRKQEPDSYRRRLHIV